MGWYAICGQKTKNKSALGGAPGKIMLAGSLREQGVNKG